MVLFTEKEAGVLRLRQRCETLRNRDPERRVQSASGVEPCGDPEVHAGVGAEVRFELFFSYVLPLTVRLGIAAGLDAGGGLYPTLGISIPQSLLGPTPARQ